MHRVVIVILTLAEISCSNKYKAFLSGYQFSSASTVPKYNNLDYWAAHPWKKDPSDSIPSDLINKELDSLVDVFFIYPTTYIEKKAGWNADINDAYLNAKTDYSTILYQASVFNQHCRVFAPRYRQAHFSAFFTDNPEAAIAFDTAYADLKNAFEYYLLHYNNNRAIIIAGHSQGAKMGERLLKEYFDGKPVQQKLVAAYLVGWPVPQNYFTVLPVCDSASQTGCFCTWRTYRTNYIPSYIKKEQPFSYVTNPLSWTTKGDYISSKQNNGSILRDFNKIIPHTTGAKINAGVLWISKPKFPGGTFYLTRNYHIADINLFYMNIRQNVEERIRAYFK